MTVLNFEQCCLECVKNQELIEEFNRLSGHQLGKPRKPIEAAIDKACGYDPDIKAISEFVTFVYAYVWRPLHWTEW